MLQSQGGARCVLIVCERRLSWICFENRHAAHAQRLHNLNFIPWWKSEGQFSKLYVKLTPGQCNADVALFGWCSDAQLVHILSIRIACATFCEFLAACHEAGIHYVYNGLSVKPHSGTFRAAKIHYVYRMSNSKSSCHSTFWCQQLTKAERKRK